MKTEYVLIFAHRLPAAYSQQSLFIRRAKQDWQHGRLNLPGGRTEPGETVQQAAARELREETGIVTLEADVQHLGTMSFPGCEVHAVFAPYRDWWAGARQQHTPVNDEGTIHEMFVRQALDDPTLIPNLRLIIPLMQARVSRWRIEPTAGEGAGSLWTIQLNEPAHV